LEVSEKPLLHITVRGKPQDYSQFQREPKSMIRIVTAVVDDMFFVSKIRETGKALGMIVNFPRNLESLRATIAEDLPALILVDLHHQKLDPVQLACELKGNEALKHIPLLGFFSHVQADLQRQAVQAGYDEVLTRSIFFRDLAKILAGESKGGKSASEMP
jgi:CheY-like chemotaxis protein